ncbi:Ig-like domain-containing protein [Tetragenococcus halophilus]|uniref:Ig-like domain-containing protein n=1 Tax=Tetragenococcus halophilus TaxID=51669 RepID=UPI0030102F29
MAILKNLIQTISPKNKSENISTATKISLTFLEDMKSSSLSGNAIYLRKINGDKIPTKIEYDRMSKKLILKPQEELDENASYEIIVQSKDKGPQSIIGTQLPSDMTSTFKTEVTDTSKDSDKKSEDEEEIPPHNITVEESEFGFQFHWESNYEYFTFKVTDEDNNQKFWPEDEEFFETKDTSAFIPGVLNPGKYLFWVKAYSIKENKKEHTEPVSLSFISSLYEEEKDDIETIDFNIEMIRSFPSNNAIVKDLDKMVVLFDKEIDIEDLPENAISIQSSEVDPLLAGILEQKSLDITIDQVKEGEKKSKYLSFSLNSNNQFVEGKTYIIRLDKNIHEFGDTSTSLGQDLSIQFTKQWKYFFTTVESVKIALGGFSTAFEEERIARMIAEISEQEYRRFSNRENFNEEEWLNNTPYYVPIYIQYKVAYMLVLNMIVKVASGQKSSISLGDLSVKESSTRSSELNDLLSALREEMDRWEEEMEKEDSTTKFASPGFAQKASEPQSYPDYFTRTPFTDLGG